MNHFQKSGTILKRNHFVKNQNHFQKKRNTFFKSKHFQKKEPFCKIETVFFKSNHLKKLFWRNKEKKRNRFRFRKYEKRFFQIKEK